jgi:hypothetical protein
MFSELTHLLPNKLQRRHSSFQIRRALFISKMKPRRKTPMLSIASEEEGAAKPHPARDRTRTSSVDLIAEQYQTLLEVRQDSVYSDAGYPQQEDSELLATISTTVHHRSSSYYLPEESPLDPSLDFAELQDISPRSENDTLVSFEDEAVYFKPVSFSPEPPSSQFPPPPSPRKKIARHLTPSSFSSSSSASSADNDNSNISLQICLDLLTRELSTAIGGGSRPASHSSSSSSSSSASGRRNSGGMSALQVWAMIEAYERLRDQLAEIGTATATTRYGRRDDDDDYEEDGRRAREMERMFDMWLRALYAIHDSLSR